MSFWDRVNERLGVARQKAAELLDLAEDLTRRGRLKLERYNLDSDVRDAMAELGGRVYELGIEQGQSEVLADSTVQALFERVESLEKKIDQKQKELDAVTTAEAVSETPPEPAGAPAAEPGQ